MIHRFLDHSANERTYMSWIRMALSVAVIGLAAERVPQFGPVTSWFGPVMIGLSLALLLLATVRFQVLRKEIARQECEDDRFLRGEQLLGWMIGVTLVAILVALLRLA